MTSLVHVLAKEGVKQSVVTLEDLRETNGVNTLEDLRMAEKMIDEGFAAP